MTSRVEEVSLNWAEATVKDAKLTVALEGKPPSGWKESFETTVRLLGDGGWGAVELKKGTIRVGDVEPGTEDKLRHYLEGVVEQANAAHREPEADDGSDDGEPSVEGPDAEMTERFRSFAPAEDDENESRG